MQNEYERTLYFTSFGQGRVAIWSVYFKISKKGLQFPKHGGGKEVRSANISMNLRRPFEAFSIFIWIFKR